MRSLMTSGLMAALLGVLPATAIAHPNDPGNQDQNDQSQSTSENDQNDQNDPSAQATGQTPELDRFVVSATSGPRLGITVMGLTPELRAHYGAPRDRGVVVAHVEQRSPAARAGLRVGDILIQVQSESVASAADVLTALTSLNSNEPVPLTVIRGNQAITLQARLPSKPMSSDSNDC